MLVLTIPAGKTIHLTTAPGKKFEISNDVDIQIIALGVDKHNREKIGIIAPKEICVYRAERFRDIKAQQILNELESK